MSGDAMAIPVHITLNGNSVVAPTLTVLRTTLEALSICTYAIDNVQAVPPLGTGFFRLRLEPAWSIDERRSAYKDWLLAKAFHDLAKGIRLSLEEAYIYVELPKHQGSTTWGKLQERIANVKKRANDLPFPDLMRTVNEGLTSKLHFEQEFLSLQKARNCLEHRNGVVGERDIDKNTRDLTLALPWVKIFYMKDGAETELAIGDKFEKDTEIFMSPKRVTEVDRFKLGDRISFTPEKFERIAYACWLFVQELGTKLPQLPVKPAA
jgi:hypothetical protein